MPPLMTRSPSFPKLASTQTAMSQLTSTAIGTYVMKKWVVSISLDILNILHCFLDAVELFAGNTLGSRQCLTEAQFVTQLAIASWLTPRLLTQTLVKSLSTGIVPLLGVVSIATPG